MISTACKDDNEQLKKIWNVCFGDEDELIDRFLDVCRVEHVLVYRDELTVVSSLYMVPMNNGTAIYLYALATLPQYRRKGIMSSLICESLKLCRKSGADYAFLIPAEEELIKYYNNLGFTGRASLEAGKNDFLVPDNAGILKFVEWEEARETVSAPKELYGAENALLCSFKDDGIPSQISGFIPF